MKAFTVYEESTYFCESREELLLALKDNEIENPDESIVELDIYDVIYDMIESYEMDYHAIIKGGVFL